MPVRVKLAASDRVCGWCRQSGTSVLQQQKVLQPTPAEFSNTGNPQSMWIISFYSQLKNPRSSDIFRCRNIDARASKHRVLVRPFSASLDADDVKLGQLPSLLVNGPCLAWLDEVTPTVPPTIAPSEGSRRITRHLGLCDERHSHAGVFFSRSLSFLHLDAAGEQSFRASESGLR